MIVLKLAMMNSFLHYNYGIKSTGYVQIYQSRGKYY